MYLVSAKSVRRNQKVWYEIKMGSKFGSLKNYSKYRNNCGHFVGIVVKEFNQRCI
jgi:hypothetical protein